VQYQANRTNERRERNAEANERSGFIHLVLINPRRIAANSSLP
jgi:hypothetical protein